MRSGGPWNLRGLRPEAREAARAAARRAHMSVGEWLNDVIAPEHDDGDAPGPHFATMDDDPDAQAREALRDVERVRERQEGRREAQRARDALGVLHSRLEKLSEQIERAGRPGGEAARPAEPQSPPYREPPPLPQREPLATAMPTLTGAPRRPRPQSNVGRSARRTGSQLPLPVSIDQAVAEIMARQRALDLEDVAAAAPRPETAAPRTEVAADERAADSRLDTTAAPAAAGIAAGQQAPDSRSLLIQMPTAEAAAKLEAPETDRAAAERPAAAAIADQAGTGDAVAPQPPSPQPATTSAQMAESETLAEQPHNVALEPAFDLTNLEQQLRHITARIEALRSSNDLENSVGSIRADLAAMARLITEALPRRAVDSLEIEVRALAQRIEHGRQCGVEACALAALERGLSEVRDALRSLAPAETLVGYQETVRELSQKLDAIVAKDDSAALQQLEAAIGALRGIVAHVASSEALAKVAEDVRALAAKVDALASTAIGGGALSALENRIDTLAGALTAATEAGRTVPHEHAAVAHLEDRIAALMQRLEASDAQFTHLEAVERGVADLLMQIEQIRKLTAGSEPRRATAPPGSVERDGLDGRQSTAETATQSTPLLALDPVGSATSPVSHLTPADERPITTAADLAAARLAAARTPIDPNLPPDHPLEPGSTNSRARPSLSAADRIAASEAAIAAAKPPLTADPGDRANFIAAARRAAQAAAATPSNKKDRKPAEASAAPSAQPKQRTRTLIVAGAAALILIGGLQIASRWWSDGRAAPPSPLAQPEQTAPTAADPPEASEQTPASPPTAAEPAGPPALPGPPASPDPTAPPPQKSGALFDPATTTPVASTADTTGTLPLAAAAQPQAGAARPDTLPSSIGSPALRAAALAGDAAAAYEIGMRFAEGHGTAVNNQDAAFWFDRAAKQGLAPAQFRLGGLYEKGIGVKKDLAAARDLYLAAAHKGNGKAMHNLAVLYAEGIDAPPDYDNASHWFREAADHGVTDSQYNLGILYARGIGVAQNLSESYKWFALAANQGDADAAKKRDEIAAKLDPQSLTAARLAVKSWMPMPQSDEAVTVKPPSGGWDGSANAAPVAKPKPRPSGAKPASTAAANTKTASTTLAGPEFKILAPPPATVAQRIKLDTD